MLVSFTFSFVAVPSLANTDLEMVNIYLRFTKNRVPQKFTVNRTIPKICWQGNKPEWCVNKVSFKEADKVNLYLNQLLAKADRIKEDAENDGIEIGFHLFKEKMMGTTKNAHMLEEPRKLIEVKKQAGGKKDVTIEKDKTLYLKFLTFLYNRNRTTKEDFNMKSKKDRNRLFAFGETQSVNVLDEATINGYELHMRSERENAQATIYKGLNYVRQLSKVAYRKKWIEENPFDHYRIEQGSSSPSFNTVEEIADLYKLWKSGILKKRRMYLHQTIRRYLVQVFTGQHFTDSLNFRFDEIENRFGRNCFERERVKNENPYFVPLLKWGYEVIMEEWEEGREQVLTRISNDKHNAYLKEAMQLIGSRKIISSKAARHSFSSMLYNFGMDEAAVAVMLGHRKRTMTQHYIHINFQRIVQEMDRIEAAIEAGKYFE